MARRGHGASSLRNTIVQSWLVTLVLQGGLVIAFGPAVLAFLCLHNLIAWFQLTSANHVEHYGPLRQKDACGAASFGQYPGKSFCRGQWLEALKSGNLTEVFDPARV